MLDQVILQHQADVFLGAVIYGQLVDIAERASDHNPPVFGQLANGLLQLHLQTEALAKSDKVFQIDKQGDLFPLAFTVKH